MLPDLLHGAEKKVWGDAGYQGQTEAIHATAPEAQHMTSRRAKHKGGVDEVERRKNRTKARVRSKADHCVDRVVINGYLSGLSRPGQVVHFFQNIVGEPVIDKEVLSRRTNEYQAWVEAFARNHAPTEWAEPKVRKEDYVRPWLRRMEGAEQHGVYFILKSMEQGQTFHSTVPRYPTEDPSNLTGKG